MGEIEPKLAYSLYSVFMYFWLTFEMRMRCDPFHSYDPVCAIKVAQLTSTIHRHYQGCVHAQCTLLDMHRHTLCTPPLTAAALADPTLTCTPSLTATALANPAHILHPPSHSYSAG